MRPIVLSAVTAIVALLGVSSDAQTPLGITGTEVRIGAVAQDTGAAQASLGDIKSDNEVFPTLGFVAVNVAVTEFHGIQGDMHLEDGPDGAIGRLGAHFYMTPQDGQKYGVFFSLADLDGEALTYATLGIEGIVAVGNRATVEMRTGIGAATAQGMDYVFAGARLNYSAFGGGVNLFGSLDLTEFDEADFSAIGQELSFGADVKLSDRIGAFTSVTRSSLNGNAAAAETTLRAGVSITMGKFGGTDPQEQAFHTADPLAQLIRRGMF